MGAVNPVWERSLPMTHSYYERLFGEYVVTKHDIWMHARYGEYIATYYNVDEAEAMCKLLNASSTEGV